MSAGSEMPSEAGPRPRVHVSSLWNPDEPHVYPVMMDALKKDVEMGLPDEGFEWHDMVFLMEDSLIHTALLCRRLRRCVTDLKLEPKLKSLVTEVHALLAKVYEEAAACGWGRPAGFSGVLFCPRFRELLEMAHRALLRLRPHAKKIKYYNHCFKKTPHLMEMLKKFQPIFDWKVEWTMSWSLKEISFYPPVDLEKIFYDKIKGKEWWSRDDEVLYDFFEACMQAIDRLVVPQWELPRWVWARVQQVYAGVKLRYALMDRMIAAVVSAKGVIPPMPKGIDPFVALTQIDVTDAMKEKLFIRRPGKSSSLPLQPQSPPSPPMQMVRLQRDRREKFEELVRIGTNPPNPNAGHVDGDKANVDGDKAKKKKKKKKKPKKTAGGQPPVDSKPVDDASDRPGTPDKAPPTAVDNLTPEKKKAATCPDSPIVPPPPSLKAMKAVAPVVAPTAPPEVKVEEDIQVPPPPSLKSTGLAVAPTTKPAAKPAARVLEIIELDDSDENEDQGPTRRTFEDESSDEQASTQVKTRRTFEDDSSDDQESTQLKTQRNWENEESSDDDDAALMAFAKKPLAPMPSNDNFAATEETPHENLPFLSASVASGGGGNRAPSLIHPPTGTVGLPMLGPNGDVDYRQRQFSGYASSPAYQGQRSRPVSGASSGRGDEREGEHNQLQPSDDLFGSEDVDLRIGFGSADVDLRVGVQAGNRNIGRGSNRPPKVYGAAPRPPAPEPVLCPYCFGPTAQRMGKGNMKPHAESDCFFSPNGVKCPYCDKAGHDPRSCYVNPARKHKYPPIGANRRK